jgi:hypothetical protein
VKVCTKRTGSRKKKTLLYNVCFLNLGVLVSDLLLVSSSVSR